MPVACALRRDAGKLKFNRPLQATVAFFCTLYLALTEHLHYAPALACLMSCLGYASVKSNAVRVHHTHASSAQCIVEYYCVDAKDLPGWKAEDLTGFREALQWADTRLTTLMITLSKLNR